MYILMCADPADELVQKALKKVDWEKLKEELGIKRNISEDAWELVSEIIEAQCAGDEGKWQHACQVFHDGDYNESEINDAILLQYDALKRMI